MRHATVVIVGAGQTGLAMSSCLADRSVDHVLLERGQVAHSWRTQRWDSLRLLTPNWQSRLPGYSYQGDHPGGFMSMPETIEYLSGYAEAISAPVEEQTEVRSVRRVGEGFVVTTDQDEWTARAVVVASGPYNIPDLPPLADRLPAGIDAVTASGYRNPGQLDDGEVLIVGAAASGVQLADEIQRSGRQVTLAVGGHVRAPRSYRGMDIMWWLDSSGVLDQRWDEVDDIVRARHVSSFQLVGSPGHHTVDLNYLQDLGVNLVGRLAGITDEGVAQFSGSLTNQCAMADLKLGRLLDSFDEWAVSHHMGSELDEPYRPEPTRVPATPPLMLRMAGRFRTVLWATGAKPDYSWLEVPALDSKGRMVHEGGLTAVPGLYLVSANFLRRRRSSFIDGAGADAAEISEHLMAYLEETSRIS